MCYNRILRSQSIGLLVAQLTIKNKNVRNKKKKHQNKTQTRWLEIKNLRKAILITRTPRWEKIKNELCYLEKKNIKKK